MTCIFGRYKNALGIPKQGVHQTRIDIGKVSIARNDVVMTVVGAFLLSLFFFNPFRKFNYYLRVVGIMLLTLFGLGILLHRLFCVRSTIDILLFPHV